jgi:hypothetical protein
MVDVVLRPIQRLERKRRTFPRGADPKTAREELTIREARNIRREDFDLDNIKPEKGMTVSKWADCYFDLEEVKSKRSLERDRQHVQNIKRHLGAKLLAELDREDLFGYKNARSEEHIISAAVRPPAKKCH